MLNESSDLLIDHVTLQMFSAYMVSLLQSSSFQHGVWLFSENPQLLSAVFVLGVGKREEEEVDLGMLIQL